MEHHYIGLSGKFCANSIIFFFINICMLYGQQVEDPNFKNENIDKSIF